MLTGELRSQVDAIWNAVWSGGIANPIEVIEQITCLPLPVARVNRWCSWGRSGSGRLRSAGLPQWRCARTKPPPDVAAGAGLGDDAA